MVIAGVCDVANSITGMAAQPYLTTLMMTLCEQAAAPFTVLCSLIFLGTCYIMIEVLAIVLVIRGAILCVVSASNSGSSNLFWAAFAAATTSFAAISFVLKEMAFDSYRLSRNQILSDSSVQMSTLSESKTVTPEDLPEKLDVFVVGLLVGFVGMVACVPVAFLNQWSTTSEPVWPIMVEGLHKLFVDREVFFSYLVYISINTLFNLSLLLVAGRGSALLAFLSLKLSVPATAVLSPIDWPYIGSKEVTVKQWVALVIMGVGISVFRFGNIEHDAEYKC